MVKTKRAKIRYENMNREEKKRYCKISNNHRATREEDELVKEHRREQQRGYMQK